MVAPVRLNQMVLGPIEIRDIGASVNDNLEGASLLGMSFLSRLRGYDVRDGVLTLRP
jgi:clan AA aspartic protease (TIGR02281 family)